MVDIIGMPLSKAEKVFADTGINNYTIVHYIDKKQSAYDSLIVTRVKLVDNNYQLLVCPMQLGV